MILIKNRFAKSIYFDKFGILQKFNSSLTYGQTLRRE